MLLALRGQPVAVLASGDPMHFGMGATLTRYIEPDEMRIIPAPSSVSTRGGGYRLAYTRNAAVECSWQAG